MGQLAASLWAHTSPSTCCRAAHLPSPTLARPSPAPAPPAAQFAAAVVYAAVSELLLQPKEYACYNKTLERIKDDPRITVRLGARRPCGVLCRAGAHGGGGRRGGCLVAAGGAPAPGGARLHCRRRRPLLLMLFWPADRDMRLQI